VEGLLRRGLDVTLALAGLTAVAPLLAALAVLVRATSPGPALYRARRVGRGRREFRMLKFRSMVQDAARIGPGITFRDDPRITPVGRVLRATKLDELPQLWNVLVGDMSLVGPRPEAPEYVALYPEEFLCVVDDVKPGVVGISQLLFRDEERQLGANVHDEYLATAMPRKLRLDRAYLRRRSLPLDLGLLLFSVLAVLGLPPGAVHRESGAH
jgi:lipopolysaccharide/colanic/teichoic acid biosynthesis glycosyltransferase